MKIISVDTMRRLEKAAVTAGVSEYRLMCRAGRGAAELLEKYCKNRFRRVVFFCGGGNNAGDALVCAAALKIPHVILPFRPLEELKGAAGEAFRELRGQLNIVPVEEFDFLPGDLIADALLGIGFTGTEIRSVLARAMEMMAKARLPIAAFDLPSGLNGDTGIAAPGTVPADLTITFGRPKQGLFLNDGPRFCGKIVPVPIGIEEFPCPKALDHTFFTSLEAGRLFPHPPLDSHKNSRARVLLLCGSSDYPGAAVLSSKGALYFAGLVRTISVQCPNMPPLPAALIARLLTPAQGGTLPEDALQRCSDDLAASNVLCAGCGWGSHVSPGLLAEVLKFQGRLVLDADALNLLARHPHLWIPRSDAVITPHPGEAARLARAFGINGKLERPQLAALLAARLGCIVVLKGFQTCVATPDGEVSLNGSGGPELAMAGSGDVLAGIIGGLAGEMENLADAVRLGVFCHGAAGDTGRGALIADDLPKAAAECAHTQTWW